MATYTSVYPTQDDSHVKATSKYDTNFWPYFATDQTKSVTGAWGGNAWASGADITTNQRFHIDLTNVKIIRRVYYENGHTAGDNKYSVQNFTVWGSNSASSFAELTYGTDTGWTQLTPSQSTFDRHVALDQADPKYITINNTTEYRYYAFKFADCYDPSGTVMGVRRIELQTEDGFSPSGFFAFL